MTSTLHRLALGVTLLAASTAGQAAVLGAVNFDESYDLPVGPNVTPPAFLILHLGYSATPGALEDPATVIFDGVQLMSGAAPFTVTLASAADDAELPAFLARATNGFDDEARINIIGNEGGGLGYATLESSVVPQLTGLPGPDLHGLVITGLELFVETLTINPTAGIGEQAWHIGGQLRVLGEVPAPVPLPGALWLLGGALPLLARRARRG